METKTIKIVMLALLAVLLSNIAYAQVCNGTVSAPTEEVYVNANFNISFFNAEGASTGGNITLNLPPGIIYMGGDPLTVTGITNFTTYQWIVNATAAGTYTFNVTMEGPVNCSKQGQTVVVVEAVDPLLIPAITNLGTLTKNSAYSVQLSLTNAGGLATDVSGTMASGSGSPIVLNTFSHAAIANSTTQTSNHIFTPGYCGLDSVTAYISNVKDENGYDVAPIVPSIADYFTVIGSDDAFTTISAESPVTLGDLATLGYTVRNIGSLAATGVTVTILIDGTAVHTDAIGALAVNASSSQTYDAATASLALGTHSVTFRVNGTTECSSPNNEVSTTFNVGSSSSPVCGNSIIETGEACDSGNLNGQSCTTLGLGFTGGTLSCSACAFNTAACTSAPGPVCGDAVCNGAETCSTCPGDCGTCPSSGSSGGGGGGGGSHSGGIGRTFYLNVTPEHPTQTLQLRNTDTVKFIYGGADYSFLFRSVNIDKTEMGVSKATAYQAYTFYTGNTYNLNLDDKSGGDLSINPYKTYIGYGNYTFTLLGFEKKPLFTLPDFSKKKTKVATANQSTEIAAEPQEIEGDEEPFSEGMLDFVETLTMRDNAPLWSGIGIAALILLVGLGSYFIITRKGSDEEPVRAREADAKPERLPETKIKVSKRR